MIVCYSYWTGDAALALETARLIAELGPYPAHDVLVLAPRGTAHRTEIVALFASTFRKVAERDIQHDYTGWPLAANESFYETALFMSEGAAPWLWMESDAVPVQRGWLDAIAQEYASAGKPILGVARVPDPSIAEPKLRPHVVGVAVYPGNMLKPAPGAARFPLVGQLHKYNFAFAAQKSKPDPFDVWIAGETIRVTHNTKLIQQNWKTRGYRAIGAEIECPREDHPDHHPVFLPETRVLPETVLLHGCKDTSLHECVRQALGLKAPALEPAPQEESAVYEISESGEPIPKIKIRDMTEAQQLEYNRHFCQWKYGPNKPPLFKGPCNARTKAHQIQTCARNLGKTEKPFTKEACIEFVAEMGQWNSEFDDRLRPIEREAVARGRERMVRFIDGE